jgi:hypothetical protein
MAPFFIELTRINDHMKQWVNIARVNQIGPRYDNHWTTLWFGSDEDCLSVVESMDEIRAMLPSDYTNLPKRTPMTPPALHVQREGMR